MSDLLHTLGAALRPDTNPQPVDVLAVMDELLAFASDEGQRGTARRGNEARAAVAELIEAAGDVRDVHAMLDIPDARAFELEARYPGPSQPEINSQAIARLAAALARVGGAK
jgi:hypothetical protein